MDLQLEELQGMSVADVLRESVVIPRAAPRTFTLINLALVFPLSFAVLAHTLFTHPILLQLQRSDAAPASEWLLLLLYQFAYLLFLFTFSLLSTAAVVFTVASLYAAKPVDFADALAAVRPIFPRLLRTFLWVAFLMILYNLVFALAVLLLLVLSPPQGPPSPLFHLLFALVLLAFLAVHVYISAIWHLASVVSVLEPLFGLAAMTKSRDLLRGRGRMAAVLVVSYLGACGFIGALFRAIVVKGPSEEGSLGITSIPAKVLMGGALVAVLVLVNLVGLLVQSVFYYVCKSYHHQQIDKSALYDHLGGYLGEYVPLKSSIQMENLCTNEFNCCCGSYVGEKMILLCWWYSGAIRSLSLPLLVSVLVDLTYLSAELLKVD